LADYTKWHTIAVEWTPDALRFFLDGRQVGVITDNVPQEKMWLGMQTAQGQLYAGIVPDGSIPTIDFLADWVEVYTWRAP
jgi:licheninase